MGDLVWDYLPREKMLELRQLAETSDAAGARFMGEKILLYHEWMGMDERWHAVVILADGTRVVIEQREEGWRTRLPVLTSMAYIPT
jgi:hypothetical protein